MMGGETFILLKAGLLGPKSEKQAEKRPAILPTILSIASLRSGRTAAKAWKNTCGLYCRRFPLDMDNSARFHQFCYPNHSFSWGFWRIILPGKAGKDDKSIMVFSLYHVILQIAPQFT
jgi:hypothetical protein